MLNKKVLLALAFGFLSTICILAQNKMYKAGEIYTENIYQYGKMEVRMLAATGSGVISNFFTFKEGSELTSTFWEEIDIEVFGKDNANSWQTNLITGQGNSNLTRTEGVHFNNGLGQEYHTYTIEWKPNSVTWLIDGEVTRTINGGQSLLVDEETSLRFNIWNPNIPEWVGPFNSNILPVSMFVNWIRFYEWNGTSFDTEPSFQDNFDTFNTNTWTKANHTFAENQSDFISENVNVVNGYLVLTITDANETGYSGTPPADSSTPNEDDDDDDEEVDDDDDEEEVDDDDDDDDDDDVSNCNFTPSAEPLSTKNKSYSNIFTIGEGAPNLNNITDFSINWDLNNNGLWQLSLNTNNGIPNWWMDLRSVSTHNFSEAEPQITFENTNITGLDGVYNVNSIGDDFVMISEDRDFSIYFSSSSNAPNCDTAAKSIPQNLTASIYPNPSSSSFTLSSNTNINKIEIFDVSGKIIETIINQNLSDVSFGEDLINGIYFVKAYDKTNLRVKQFKLIKN